MYFYIVYHIRSSMSSDILSNEKKIKEVAEALKMDGAKGRYWAIIVYPSELFCKSNGYAAGYALQGARAGWGEAPDDWQEVLKQLGLSFICSPIHDQDTDEHGDFKKPHYHVIVMYGNTTTYKCIKERICDYLKSPRPMLLNSPCGYYCYLDHSDDESVKDHKHLYDKRDIMYVNCSPSDIIEMLDESTHSAYLMELVEFIRNANIRTYDDFLFETREYMPDLFDLAVKNAYFFSNVLKGNKERLTSEKIELKKEVLNQIMNGKISDKLAIELLKGL